MTDRTAKSARYHAGMAIALKLSLFVLMALVSSTTAAPSNNSTTFSSDQMVDLIYDEQELGLLRQAYEMAAPLQIQGFLNSAKFIVIEMRLSVAIKKHNMLVAQLFKGNETRIREMSLEVELLNQLSNLFVQTK